MRAVVVSEFVTPDKLAVAEIDEPKIEGVIVGVQIHASACNFFDILQVQGKYQHQPPFPFTPGAEIAGVVYKVGEDVTDFKVGDRVFGAIPYGGYAEKAAIPCALLQKIPDGMSFDEAACLPVTYPTSYAALVLRAKLQAGETLLVHAAAGGVGIAAVQIGKALGARVIACAGSEEKLQIAKQNGADHIINTSTENWVEVVNEITDGNGADVIYDPVGGDYFDKSLRCIAWNGRILVIGFASGTIPSLKINRVLLKNISVVGLHWGAYMTKEAERIPEVWDGIFRLYAEKKLRPVVCAKYPLEQLPQALADLATRKTYGKAIICPQLRSKL
eukprot:TRINITY_DN2601_c0_g2_i1.p1 TRINITY_DN2601_c0_g2~~TRINITY_DN2601_c0_g2_i1.p1  ORF type:complete len:331 (-),score=79.25 TRINITY_DN2601_c0_g2_i1:60-1052(-)